MAETGNDNGSAGIDGGARRREPDAHGQAAMLLVESLIHQLVARSVLSVRDAVEIIEVAVDVEYEIAAERGDTPAAIGQSLVLLESVIASFQYDLAARGEVSDDGAEHS